MTLGSLTRSGWSWNTWSGVLLHSFGVTLRTQVQMSVVDESGWRQFNLAMIWRPGHETFWHAVCSLGCLIELNCYDSFHFHSFTPFFNGTMITYDKHLCEKKATTVPPNAEECTQCTFFPPTMRGSSLHRHGPGHGANELAVGLVPENRGFPLQPTSKCWAIHGHRWSGVPSIQRILHLDANHKVLVKLLSRPSVDQQLQQAANLLLL